MLRYVLATGLIASYLNMRLVVGSGFPNIYPDEPSRRANLCKSSLRLSRLPRSYATLPPPMSNLRCVENQDLFYRAEVMVEPVEYFLEEWHGEKPVAGFQHHAPLVCRSGGEAPAEA